MKRSYLIAAALALAAAGWIASGQLAGDQGPKAGQKPPADLSAAQSLPTVRVRRLSAEPRVDRIVLRGRTEAERKVEVKAETHGRIVKLPIEQGDVVRQGDVLARLAGEDRPARVAEAKALFEQRRIEYEAAERLAKKGFRAETQLAGARAALDAARAALTRAEIENDNTVIRAPFDGLVGERMAELGAFAETGTAVARLVDLDPLLAVADISERERDRVSVGGVAWVRLVGGTQRDGQVRFIASEADPATRTFRIEVALANPDRAIADGMTAEILLPLEQIAAHRVSPAVLTLTDEGVIGVKTLGPDNRVEFVPVRIVGDGPEGVWLTGLPRRVTLITVGQEFVAHGQRVRPIDEETLRPIGGEEAS